MKNIFVLSVFALLMSSVTMALSLDDFNSGGIGAGLGLISATDNSMVMNLTLNPDLKFGDFGLGLDINLLLNANARPADFNSLVVRYVEYDNGSIGLRYGVLDDVDYGYGLIMNQYTSRLSNSSILTPQQMGVAGYVALFSPITVKAFGTNSRVIGLRLEDRLSDNIFFGKPLIAGLTYVTDIDGVSIATTTNIIGVGQAAIGVDLGIPLIEGQWDLFVEWAGLSNVNSALSAGTKYILNETFDFQLAYQVMGENFVPGYFYSDYEVSPYNLSTMTSEGKVGWVGTLGMNLMDYVRVEGAYNNYTTSSGAANQSLSLAAGIQEINGIAGVFSYSQPNFAGLRDLSSNNATTKLEVSYRLNQWSRAIATYQTVYVTSTEKSESYKVEYKFDLPLSF